MGSHAAARKVENGMFAFLTEQAFRAFTEKSQEPIFIRYGGWSEVYAIEGPWLVEAATGEFDRLVVLHAEAAPAGMTVAQ